MKTVVSLQDLLELEIRPGDLLGEYHRLAETAVRGWREESLEAAACPACGGTSGQAAFSRFGRSYRECDDCRSVYLSPRPAEQQLVEHARSSAAATFWRERVLPQTEAARREKILVPRADWVADGVAEYLPGTGPALDIAGLPEVGGLAAHPDGSLGVVTAFEVLDRAGDPRGFVREVHRVLRPGGLLFATAPTASGFEIQALWDRARTIVPPDKINLISIAGFFRLFGEGWEIIELSTPGMFDVETVRRAVLAEPDAGWPRVLRALVDTDERSRGEFQEYLQRMRLASFARLLVRRS